MGLNSADYIHTSVEAVKLAMADRDTYLGDTNFIKIPFAGLLSKQYAADRRKLIDPQRASAEFRPGVPGGEDIVDRPRDLQVRGEADHTGDTSYLAVIDKDRNMVSFEPSLHTAFGGDMAVEERIRADVRAALIKRGHKLTVSGQWVMGSMGAIMVDHKNGTVAAGADPRVDAYALAW